MKLLKILFLIPIYLGLVVAQGAHSDQENMLLAAGAGYKKPVIDLIHLFEDASDCQVDSIFGNLQTVTQQASLTGDVSCVIGDRRFLENIKETITFDAYYPIGRGILVLACRDGLNIEKMKDLTRSDITTIFMPQEKKAIYGMAACEAIRTCGLTEKLQHKLTQVATVPQVVSYLISGEVDAGFINLTEYLAHQNQLGSYFLVDPTTYSEISIVIGVVKGYEQNGCVQKFIKFAGSDEATKIFEIYGLK